MKILRNFLLMLLCVVPMTTIAQENTVKWSQTVTESGNGNYTVQMKAQMADGWHIYDLGPYEFITATSLKFEPSEGVKAVGEMRVLSKAVRHMDDIFGIEIGYFEKEALFEQDFEGEGDVKVAIEYMACNDTNCTPPAEEEVIVTLGKATDATKAEVKAVKDAAGDGSLWSLIIEAILWGFAALLTPCVFPMVPMTVSFFMKNSGSAARGRINASLYGLFIVALYTLPIAILIIITRIVGGDAVTADIFNWLATHWLPNILFFVVFMIFAASFFGAFEITMPSALVNKSDAKSDKGGIGGIFFMALTLVLVSFSCTGPIVGSVLIKSTSGEVWSPIITMLAFSTAFALPFTLFAFFPSLLQKLPKSGGWLNSVKVVLGFVEVALGFKFLSVADQVYHWNLLDREVYLAIWIVVFSLLGLYLLGKIKFAHDSEVKHLSVGRLALAIGVFTFVVYMIPGMWGAPLKALSGYLPPLSSQDFVIEKYAPAATSSSGEVDVNSAKYSDVLHLPHGLKGFFDMKEAEAYAAKVGKPIFIDFTGHGCVNCREMEARVWADPAVQQILRDEYVIVALYTDDKMPLPESDWVTTESGKVLKTLGKVNANYALTRFGVNAQPYYVLQGKNGEILGEPRGYDLSVEGFIEFLKKGVEEYKK
ncbi:MAG: thiol:disulfide interchange protein [Rikenellaceae bacterium]|nr:thiol:disulfide interchange protein [Rikenellaceae bacterium]